MKKISSQLMLILLFAWSLSVVSDIHPVEAEPGTICIRANGGIDPPTTNITTSDNVTYTFTDNIADSIVVERGYIVVDGAGYTLQGTGSGNGLYLASGISSVTVKNTNIKNFNNGIWLRSSTDNTISANNITNNLYCGIVLESSSSYNAVSGNNVSNNQAGIWLDSSSSHNTISANDISNNNQAGDNQARACFFALLYWNKDEFSFRVNESLNQPRTSGSVNMHVLSCYPFHLFHLFVSHYAKLARAQ